MRREGTWEGEGFGRVYVEAALAGKPVVGSRQGGAAEAVLHGQTGLLVDPTSVEETARAIIALLENPTAAIQMGQQGRLWAQRNFTEDALRRSLGGLLQDAKCFTTELTETTENRHRQTEHARNYLAQRRRGAESGNK